MKALALVFAAALSLQGSPNQAEDLAPRAKSAIDEAMQTAMREQAAPGGAVAVMDHSRILLAKGWGLANLEDGTPVTPDTVFRIGSLTKQFTAASVLLLAEDGKLSLDDRAVQYLPDHPQLGEVTLRQLLNQTAGLADLVGRPGFFDRESMWRHTPDEVVRYVLDKSPLFTFPPGDGWAYSNSNYEILGLIVERVSGQSLGTFMKARLFDPLGLKDTALDDERDIVPHRASGYDRTPGGWKNAAPLSLTVPYAAGAMRSTARDLLVWENALVHGRVLGPEMLRQMLTPAVLKDGSTPMSRGAEGKPAPVFYGLGVFMTGAPKHRILDNSGSVNGFSCELSADLAEDRITVVLFNTLPNAKLPTRAVITDAARGP
ncbi:MAG TPA: serine hydrolase domain-containing protein [Caulobacteraceae bacterium]|jgi:CubicO group peptidase (beta-lactamase class C family)|nr:serine hydrolase domain-containing protein [Caulobacteraceae bacterium]